MYYVDGGYIHLPNLMDQDTKKKKISLCIIYSSRKKKSGKEGRQEIQITLLKLQSRLRLVKHCPQHLTGCHLNVLLLSNLFIYSDNYSFCVIVIVGPEIALEHHVDKIPFMFGIGFYKKRWEKQLFFYTGKRFKK
jgi:hypothetical protein